MISEITISLVGLLGIIVGAYLNHLFEKKKEIELHFKERKEEQYKKFLEFLIGFFEGWDANEDHKKEFMRELYTHAPLYASSEVIKLANKFLACFSDKKDLSHGGESDQIYRKLALEIRKDLNGPGFPQSLMFWEKGKDNLLEEDINVLKLNFNYNDKRS